MLMPMPNRSRPTASVAARVLAAGLLAAGVVATPIQAQDAISSDGHLYARSCNASGVVLTSLYPVARYADTSADATASVGTEKLYLGVSCDAFTQTFGTGSWCAANGGYVVEFDAYRIGFLRQDPACPAMPDLAAKCGC